jgi:hypothetical protein
MLKNQTGISLSVGRVAQQAACHRIASMTVGLRSA